MSPYPRPVVLERKIATLKQQLMALGDLRPGSLSEQYNVCGTPGCQCKADPPRKHGPYYQLSYVHRGKSTSQFIRPQFLREVKAQLANYKQFRRLIDTWIHFSIEYARARLDELKRSTSHR